MERRDHPNVKCPHCDKVGFVRHENVVKGNQAERHFFCGACDHKWAVVDSRGLPSGLTVPPDPTNRNDAPAT
jgi:hypothetical protein